MRLSFEDFTKVLIAQMTDDERLAGVAYAAEKLLPAGTTILYPGRRIETRTDSYLGFIDRNPRANWGHSARYVIIPRENEEIQSLEARLPPFGSGAHQRWRVAYQAPTVPNALVAHPSLDGGLQQIKKTEDEYNE